MDNLFCEVCLRETSGEMGTGEFYTDAEGLRYWWCRLCKKCPHDNCKRLRCLKNNMILSHCGKNCKEKTCFCVE